jgi:uncharacterized spore protein YtfJ
MNIEGLTIYNQNGGFKSLGWDINNSILNGSASGSMVVPAGLLYVNNNLKSKHIKGVEKGVVNSELFDRLYSFIDGSKPKHNKTKKNRKRKRKNKTRKY